MTVRSSLLRFAAASTLLGVCAIGACIKTESYVYSAQKYDPAAGCVAAYASVELVNGPGVGSQCPATCLRVGGDLYVSTMCPPLPTIATEVPAGASDCLAALAAAKRGGTCDSPEASAIDAGGGAVPVNDAASGG
jgi:hypothetical protein